MLSSPSSRFILILTTVLIIGLFVLLAAPVFAASVTNGNFNSGLTGWGIYQTGSVSWVSTGGVCCSGGFAPPPSPPFAHNSHGGAHTAILYQDIALESGYTHNLSLLLGYNNQNGGWVWTGNLATSNQYLQVDIANPAAAPNSMNPGDIWMTIFAAGGGTPTVRNAAPLTANLNAFAGSTVRLRIIADVDYWWFPIAVDDVTITSTPTNPSFSINDVTLAEGSGGTTNFVFTVTRSGNTTGANTVDFTTADGSASAGSGDYTAQSGTLTFNSSVTTQTVTVAVNGDTNLEPNEAFVVNLSNAAGANSPIISDNQGVGTITNDDAAASFSINDVTLAEGNSGTTNFVFTVTRSGNTTGANTVDFATADGAATVGSGDYTAQSGTLTFNSGDLTQTITVVVNGDTNLEPNEAFVVNLSNATGANAPAITDNQGVGTISNDDAAASFAIGDASAAENGGSIMFTVTRSGNTTGANTVDFASTDGSASAGSDYTTASGTLTFNAGDLTQTITVTLTDDTNYEGNEDFVVDLSNAAGDNAPVIGDTQATGTIIEDDGPASFSIGDVSAAENGGSITFTVTRSGNSAGVNTVDFASTDGSASAGSDYTTASGTLTFNAGDLTQTITVTLTDDTDYEGNEDFVVDLSNAAGDNSPTIGDTQATGTILEDDGPASFSIDDVSVVEGAGSITGLIFTVTRSGNSTGVNTVDFASTDGSASAGSDYTTASGTLTFNAGDLTQTITITIADDANYEGNEDFVIDLSNAAGDNSPTISDNQGIGTIIEDETTPGLSVNDVVVSEAAGAGFFTVSLSPASGSPVTVDYTLADGSAVSGTDYTATMLGTLNFGVGVTSQTVNFNVTDNAALDGNRAFTITLSNSSGPAIVDNSGIATIQDDETPPPPPPPAEELPTPPPAPRCDEMDYDANSVVRTHFTNDADRPHANCRMIVENGNYMSWYGGLLTRPATVGSQTVLDLGVLQAVDVFSPSGATGYVGDVNICLKGAGYIIYLGVNGSPRVPQLWSAWTTDAFPGYTCTTLYAPGTVVLVTRKP